MRSRRSSNFNLCRVTVLKGEVFPGPEAVQAFIRRTYGLPSRLSIGRLQPLCEKLQPGIDLNKTARFATDRGKRILFSKPRNVTCVTR